MKMSDFLTDVGRPVAYYPGLRKITGSTTATIFFCQFFYWTGKEKSGDGWIYKTSAEIEEETGLSYNEQKTAREKLKSAKLLKEKYQRLDHMMYFKINLDKLNELWGNPPSEIPECDKVTLGNDDIQHSLISNTETTTENTSLSKKDSLKKDITAKGGLDWQVLAGMPSEVVVELDKTFALRKERTDEYERVMGYNPLNWGSKELAPLEKFLAKQSLEDIRRFAIWSKREYSTLNPAKARQYPRLVIDLWPQACPPIEVRKPEPPKEKEVYLSGEELVRRLKGEK